MEEQFASVRIAEAPLRAFVDLLLRNAGSAADAAAAVSRSVVEASLRGIDTHGVRLAPHYLRCLYASRLNPKPKLTVTRSAPAVAHVDADNGFGHFASYRAIDEGMAMAAETGIAAVTVGNSSHHGATGGYALAAARNGFAAIAMTIADAAVAPFGGVKAFNGTNPIAFAVPVAGAQPMVLDMATSSIPLNRVHLRRATGTQLPADVAIDADGHATRDPNRFGALLPLGGSEYGYKGAGLAAMVDILCSAFSGMPHGNALTPFSDPSLPGPDLRGHFFVVMRPELFQSLAVFDAKLSAFLADLRGQPAHPGKRVMAPGDPELAAEAERRANGIPVDLSTWDALREFARRQDVRCPSEAAAEA